MSLVAQINTLITRIGTEFKTTKNIISGNSAGDLSGLSTTAKNNLVAAINELKAGYNTVNTAVNKNKGWYATSAALIAAYPAASGGDYAIVGATDTVWIWDTDGAPAWKDGDTKGQVISVNGQTGAVNIGQVTTGADGLMIAADKTKLNSIAGGATANDTDANLRNRATHTGTQTAATISDWYSSIVNLIISGYAVGANAIISNADSILSALGKLQGQINGHFGAGGGAHTAVVSGGAAGFMIGTDKTKLDGIAGGATANDTDANLRNRATHTGTQTAATISDFTAAVNSLSYTKAEIGDPTTDFVAQFNAAI